MKKYYKHPKFKAIELKTVSDLLVLSNNEIDTQNNGGSRVSAPLLKSGSASSNESDFDFAIDDE